MSRFRACRLSAGVLAALAAGAAAAHGGDHAAVAGHGWSFDPLIGSLMLASIAVQLVGWHRLGPARAAVAPPGRIASYWAAMATVALALFSPLDARADTRFAWHMLQHLLLMLVAAPLLARSNLHFVALFALPRVWRARLGGLPGLRRSSRSRVSPWLAAAAFTVGLWLWHAPALYEAALRHRAVHSLEHLVFLVTAAVFWRMVATAGDRRLGLGTSVVLLSLVGLQGNLMAALITLAPEPLYPSYAGTGALADQQLAGLAMWVPAGLIYLASSTWALYRLIAAAPPRRARRHAAGA